MAPQITLYHFYGSCGLVPHIILNYLGIPFTSALLKPGPNGIEAADGSFNSTEYKGIQFHGFVPALKVTPENAKGSTQPCKITPGETVVTELPAIITYIAKLAPEKTQGLLPDSALEQAQIQEWTTWLSGTLHGYGWAMWLRPTRFAAPDVPGVNDDVLGIVKETGRRKVLECFDRIESRLSGDGYAVGGKTTVVDFPLAVFYSWGKRFLGLDMSQYAKYSELVKNVLRLDTVKETIEKEGQSEWYAGVI